MRIKDLREDADITQKQLAEFLNIKQNTYSQYENGQRQIPIDALIALARYYRTSTDYLLGLTEQKNHPNADINNLQLSDTMIDLLESGKINTRLLCEIATHEDFRRFLTDIEIYVDRIADMKINDLNSMTTSCYSYIINLMPNGSQNSIQIIQKVLSVCTLISNIIDTDLSTKITNKENYEKFKNDCH